MDKKTARFLLSEAALILFVLLLSQIFPYPLSGKEVLEERLELVGQQFEYRVTARADLKSSVLYILEIDGQYCEKQFDKSLIFNRYIEKPLVLLRPVGQQEDLLFVARDSARSHLYAVDGDGQIVLHKQTNMEWFTLAYVLGGGTLILLGMYFGTGKRKAQRGQPADSQKS